MPLTTEDCVAARMAKYPETARSDWKRRRKVTTEDGEIHRYFDVSGLKGQILVVEFLDNITSVEDAPAPAAPAAPRVTARHPHPKSEPTDALYKKLKANQITVDLHSRRTLFARNEERGEEEYNPDGDGLNFYCGPEVDGALDDQGDSATYRQLNRLFSDFPARRDYDGTPQSIVEIGASESAHIVQYCAELTYEQVWEIVRERLLRSGAVDMDAPDYAPDRIPRHPGNNGRGFY
jgi:hypothetical protein